MALSRQQLDEIRERVDIVDLVGSYLTLKRAGTAYKAVCPFHKEKTPSFTVNPQRQIYHCFGCGAGGDVFKFVMQYENVEFMEAVRMLAQRAGVALQFDQQDKAEEGLKEQLYRVHEEATPLLPGRAAPEQGGGRRPRVPRETTAGAPTSWRRSGLGFAPRATDVTLRFGEKHGFAPALLETSGLLAKSEDGRSYDRFRDRLMFPIRDLSGRVIAFSGRILEKEASPAKYLNSPETPLFRKSKVLYAMDRARKSIIEARTCLLCEGQIDVIRCHGAGITNAVAGLGTAITEEHSRLIKRHADTVTLLMDADTAGQNSAIRSAEIFLEGELSVQVAALPVGEDPDSLIVKRGADALREVLGRARSVIDFQIDVLSAREDLKTEQGFRRVAKALLETIQHAQSGVQRDQLLREAASRLGVSETALREDLRRTRVQPRTQAETAPGPAPVAPAAPPPVEEKDLLRLLLHHPDTAELVTRFVKPEQLSDPRCQVLVKGLLDAAQVETDITALARDAGEACLGLISELMAEETRYTGADEPQVRAAQDLIVAIRRRAVERRLRTLLAEREKAGDAERERLTQEVAQIKYDLAHLRQGWEKAMPILELDE
jgi:DNA primase